MKNIVRTTALVIATLGLVASVAAAPELTIPVKTFDFGYVPQQSKVSHVFWLHSTGEDSLRILKIVPG